MPPSIRPNVCRALYRLCQPAAPSTRARLGWFGVTSPSLLLLGKTRVKREDLERQGGEVRTPRFRAQTPYTGFLPSESKVPPSGSLPPIMNRPRRSP